MAEFLDALFSIFFVETLINGIFPAGVPLMIYCVLLMPAMVGRWSETR